MTLYQQRVVYTLPALCIFFLLAFSGSMNPARGQAATNVIVRQIDDTVKITYDIEAKKKDFYNITLRVSADSGQTFTIHPKNVRGDVHYGVPAATDRVIIWEPLRDSLELSGTGFVFRVTGTPANTGVDTEFIYVKGGTFEMGDPERGDEYDEQPVHTVTVGDFEISMFEITNFQFSKFLQAYGSDRVKDGEFWGEPMVYEQDCGMTQMSGLWVPQPGYDYHPAVGVTWYGANEYCQWRNLRLPTEAEWEYAARSCGKKIRFGNSTNSATPLEINFNGNPKLVASYSTPGQNRGSPARVSSFAPNDLGLFDMSGNVWEWCQDWYSNNYYPHSPAVNPCGPWLGQYKTIRGGAYSSSPQACRTAERSSLAPFRWKRDVGFRVVRPVQPPPPQSQEHEPSEEIAQ